MHARHGRPDRRIRSIFLSDTHLGCKYSHAAALLEYLNYHQPEFLYLVGDIVDGWRLKRSWYWQPVYNQILRRLLTLAEQGTLVRYTPGNHDNFLRPFLRDFGNVLANVEIRDEFLHIAADGRRYVVLHGDQFDTVEIRTPWISMIGAIAYDSLMWTNSVYNQLRRGLGLQNHIFTTAIKQRVKSAVTFVSNYEKRLSEYAHEKRSEGIICGHIHTPLISDTYGIKYCNTGDWVEHCTALVEFEDGSLELQYPLRDGIAPYETQETNQDLDCSNELLPSERVPKTSFATK